MKRIVAIAVISILSISFTYSQCIKGDCIDGTGTKLYDAGGKYQGEFKDGKRNGMGTYVWKSGAKYKGTWVDNKMAGSGTYIYPDKRVYRGAFKNGMKHGEGVISRSKSEGGKIIQKGIWKDDMYQENSKTYQYAEIGYSIVEGVLPDIDFLTAGTCTYVSPITLGYDVGITNNINVGGFLGYAQHNYSSEMTIAGDSDNFDVDYRYILVGGRVTYNFHLGSLDIITPYVGALAGYNIRSESYSSIGLGDIIEASVISQVRDNAGILGDLDSELVWGGIAGVRVFPLKKIGGFFEGGVGYSNLRAGLTVRL